MAKKDPRSVGRRIRQFRELAGMSQADLGDKLDVSYQQVQKYERGANRVSVDTLVKVARALDLPIGAFLELPEGAKPVTVAEPKPEYTALTREERELLKAFRELPDDKVRAAFLLTLKAVKTAGR